MLFQCPSCVSLSSSSSSSIEILFSVVFGLFIVFLIIASWSSSSLASSSYQSKLFIVIVSVEIDQTIITISAISRRNADERRPWRNSFSKHRNRSNPSRQGRIPFGPRISFLFKRQTAMLPRCSCLLRSTRFRNRIPSIPTLSPATLPHHHRLPLNHSNTSVKKSSRMCRHPVGQCSMTFKCIFSQRTRASMEKHRSKSVHRKIFPSVNVRERVLDRLASLASLISLPRPPSSRRTSLSMLNWTTFTRHQCVWLRMSQSNTDRCVRVDIGVPIIGSTSFLRQWQMNSFQNWDERLRNSNDRFDSQRTLSGRIHRRSGRMDDLARRNKKYKRDGQTHQYVMSLIHGTVIDSTVKGNWARFINHSCEPTCAAEKWLVNGEHRMGLFPKRDLVPGEEITIDYRFETFGTVDLASEKCYCGAPTCRGTISVRNNQTSTNNNSNKRQSRRQPLDDDKLLVYLRDETTNDYLLPKTIDEIRQLIQIMSRTDSENVRTIELDLIRTGSQKQVELPRLFLECNGLHVLGSWMKDILIHNDQQHDEQQYSKEFQITLLDFIHHVLPIKDRTNSDQERTAGSHWEKTETTLDESIRWNWWSRANQSVNQFDARPSRQSDHRQAFVRCAILLFRCWWLFLVIFMRRGSRWKNGTSFRSEKNLNRSPRITIIIVITIDIVPNMATKKALLDTIRVHV